MQTLNNNLQIKNLFYDPNQSNTNLFFSFLFLTDPTFRNLSPENKQAYFKKYKAKLSSKLSNMNLENKLPINITDLIVNDSATLIHTIYIIEHLLKIKYSVVISENGNFTLSTLNDNFMIIYKKKNQFFPVMSSTKYLFSDADDVIQIIKQFADKSNPNVLVFKPKSYEEKLSEQFFILDQDDLIFDDLDQEIYLTYENKAQSLNPMTPEEQYIQIDNLLKSFKIYTSPKTFFDLIKKTTHYPVSDAFHLINHTKTTSTSHNTNQISFTYLEDFENYKSKFSKPFFKTVYRNNDSFNRFAHNETVIKDSSFTEPVETKVFDNDDCLLTLTKDKLLAIAHKYGIQATGSKEMLCKILSNYNFLADDIIQHFNKMSKKNLSQFNENDNTSFSSKKQFILYLLENNKLPLDDIFTLEYLQDVATKAGLSNLPTNKTKLINTLMSVNLLPQNNQSTSTDDNIEYDLVDLEPVVKKPPLHTFVALAEDKISYNGFFYHGDTSDESFQTVDLANHFHILLNIKSLLPCSCTIVYFDNTPNVQGNITECSHNDTILKIITSENTIVYYNLKNIHDNNFFLYSQYHDSYQFDKRNINTNVFFKIDTFDYSDMVKLVSLSLSDYLRVFVPTKIDNQTMENLLLKNFNKSILQLTEHDTRIMSTFLNNQIEPHNNSPTKHRLPSVSKHKFLKSYTTGTDTYKMAMLHADNNYPKIIHDIYAASYLKEHSGDNTDEAYLSSSTQEIVNIYEFKDFTDLQQYKTKITPIIDSNSTVMLNIHKQLYNDYLKNKKDILTNYTEHIEATSNFFNHEINKSDFKREMSYVCRNTDKLQGNENLTNKMLINSNPNNVYDPIPYDEDNENRELIGTITSLLGFELSKQEKKYITQNSDRYINILFQFKLLKNKKSFTNDNDKSMWTNYTRMCVFGAFITLIVQYNYQDIKSIFNKCKALFSLHGFPMNDAKEASLTKYIGCVFFKVFGKTNNYFQSENSISSQIEAIVRLIFQQNPLLKEQFGKSTIKKKSPITYSHYSLKPFSVSEIDKNIKAHINKSNLSSNFKLHKLSSTQENIVCMSYLMQIISPLSPKKDKITYTDQFKNIKFLNIDKKQNAIVPITKNTDFDKSLSKLIDQFVDGFKVDLNPFIDAFVVNADSAKKYLHLLKPNVFYINMMYAHTYFTERRDVFEANRAESSKNVLQMLFNTFDSFIRILSQLFDTDNIYSFLNTELDTEKRHAFTMILNKFVAFLNTTVASYNNQFVKREQLEKRKEILREEEKQKKLNKYNNMNDDQIHVIIELEKQLGISIDVQESYDDIEAQSMDHVISEDDDIPE